jgi:hypothetical protein
LSQKVRKLSSEHNQSEDIRPEQTPYPRMGAPRWVRVKGMHHQAKDHALTHQPLPSTRTGTRRPAQHTQRNSPDTIRHRGPLVVPSRATHVLATVGVVRR